ncbi:MAG TPA: hypothetical protein VFA14_04575 [Herbaspirillum sp.]|nr:hypothetical protein [Herbaspirillum sp.]
MAELLRFPFENAHAIPKNFSQAWQDLFVLSMLDGRCNGRYLEIGANFARSNNNTCLLSSSFGWEGVSIEFDPQFLRSWQQERPDSNLVIADALALDYAQALPRWFGADCKRLDYLQLDIDPSYNTLLALKRLPLDDWRFSVITFETDAYAGDLRARDESREIFSRHHYELVAADLCVLFVAAAPDPIPFEDWWVDPQVVSRNKIDTLKRLATQPLLPQHLLFDAG